MRKKKYRWSSNLAYVVGLIASDGCLSKDGRHIDLTSADLEQVQNFKKILKLTNTIGFKSSGLASSRKYYRIQFGNVGFYRFLLKVGLTSNKSKTVGVLQIPSRYLRDFLRGSLDGDGYTYSYWDSRWKSSFMLYTGFVSASKLHLVWIKDQIQKLYHLNGSIKLSSRVYQLNYAKKSSVVLLNKIYYKMNLICLSRKHSKIQQALSIISKHADVL